MTQNADSERVIAELRARLAEAESIVEMAMYSGSYEGDMLDLMRRRAEEYLSPNGSSETP